MIQTAQNNLVKIVLSLSTLLLLAVPLTASAADTTVSVSVGGAITTFTTSGTVTLGALTPDATGRQSTNSDTVTVATNDTSGYSLTLEDADTDVNLVSGGNNFTPTDGDDATPETLENGEWGWRIDSFSGFGAGPTTVISSAAPSALTFAAMTPSDGAATEINDSTGTGSEVTTVWYSARANTSQPEGTYTDTVTYTATVN